MADTETEVAIRIAEIREDLRAPGEAATDRIREDHLPALLAVADAVLKLHRPQDKPVHSWDHVCPAHRDRRGLAIPREALGCPDCRFSEITVCRHCTCPNDEWPCPTYRRAEAALLSEGET
jgi:hypothetical protein